MPLLWSRGIRAPLMRFTRNHHWPSTQNPTPYEIFGLNPLVKPKEKQVRMIFYDLVKIYHPDHGGNADQFKRIVEAHKILKDHCNGIKTATNSQETSTPYHYYHPQSSAKPFDDYAFYNSNKSQAQFDESLRANRLWVLKLVVSVTIVVALLNLIFIKKASSMRSDNIRKESEKVASSLLAQSLNDPNENTSESRIARFLAHRQRTIDKYEEFCYDSFSKDLKRRQKSNIENELNPKDIEAYEDKAQPHYKTPPPTKHNTGKIAEFFGRD